MLHLAAKLFTTQPSIPVDFILYNLIWILVVISITQSPLSNDPVAVATTTLAITAWGSGSILSSYGQFFSANTDLIAQITYTAFYPLALLALPRFFRRGRRLSAIEILDSTIFGLGLTSILTATLIVRVIPTTSKIDFFTLLYPVCDLILIVITSVFLLAEKFSRRAFMLAIGIFAFTTADFYFLSTQLNSNYTFAQISDDGWLLGMVLIALAFWQRSTVAAPEIAIPPALIALSIFASPTLLALFAIRPGIFPNYILLPIIATLLLAFIRASILIRQANNLGEEKILARTDELTGLPNRRRLISELSTYGQTIGALLLLDLDGFKPVNDQFGHDAGDLILKQVAQRFSRVLPTGSVLARLGGDEFAVLVTGRYEMTLEIAHSLRATLSYPFTVNQAQINIGVSVGHVQNDGSGNLLERADAAMYEAKRSGLGIYSSS